MKKDTTKSTHAVKPIIYQLIPRLFANYNSNCVANGSFEQNGSGKLNDINPTILKNIRELGATHVWYTGIIEHAHTSDYSQYGIRPHNPHVVKGKAGSPYAITDYYDIDPDLAVNVDARIEEFEKLVRRTHRAGLKVIIDFVPNHVGREYFSDAKPSGIEDFGHNDNKGMFFCPANNFYYITNQKFSPVDVDLGTGQSEYIEFPARASGDDCFTAFPCKNNWFETVKLNYGIDPWNGSRHFSPIPSTWHKMVHILLYWARKGVDGFRCDMAYMVPVDFWRWAIPQVKELNPDIKFIAELYDVAIYRSYIYDAGFDYLYDKVNLYDTLRAIETSNVSAANITSCWQTIDGIQTHMLNFLENHDEQRFASRFYAGDAMRAVPSLVVSAMISTGPFMLYAGQELGEEAEEAEGYSGLDGRTTIFDYWSMERLRRWLNHGRCDGKLTETESRIRSIYRRVLNLCNSEPAIYRGSFFDLMYVNTDNPDFNPHRQYAFLRAVDDDILVIAVNFDNRDVQSQINIPAHAFEHLAINQGIAQCTDLLSQHKSTKTISSDQPFATHIPANGAVVWKIKNSTIQSFDKQ